MVQVEFLIGLGELLEVGAQGLSAVEIWWFDRRRWDGAREGDFREEGKAMLLLFRREAVSNVIQVN